MIISADTKISALIKQNPATIDAIASINKHFEKLRNPVLRKILASRVTIADAAKIGGCSINVFFEKLQPLGFTIQTTNTPIIPAPPMERPDFMQKLDPAITTTLDVREDLATGKDPFKKIMDTLSSMPQQNFLLIINSFEPTPLINILKKKGFDSYVEMKENSVVYTYLKNTTAAPIEEFSANKNNDRTEFKNVVIKFGDQLITIDVRNLEMPLPMVTILKELETLPENKALYVHHKKIPQFLLPELREQGFTWYIDEISEGDVKMLICR